MSEGIRPEKMGEVKLTTSFAESLPPLCPPSDAVDQEIDTVFRLVSSQTPTIADFNSKAAQGHVCPAHLDACSWASCSLFKEARSLLKYTRLRLERPYLATLKIPIGVGMHKISGKRGHVDFWSYSGTSLSGCVVAIEGPHNDQ